MYDNSRLPSYINAVAHPYDNQFSRWSLNTSNTPTVINQTVPQSTTALSLSSSFYLPRSQRIQQTTSTTPNYVNIRPSFSTISSIQQSNCQRPKSTMLYDPTPTNESMSYLNDLRQRYESKGIVGIVKPMVHQRSYTQLNHDYRYINSESKVPEMTQPVTYHNSTRSLCPLSTSPPSPSANTSVMYRSRRQPINGNLNGPPPAVPRRHSSISNNKYALSYRSSRTTSTTSSVVPTNELSSTSSSQDDEQDKTDDKPVLNVKRLEMFYSSVGTVVKSARSMARLYLTTTRQLAGLDDWSCQQYGVPLWIYNTVRIQCLVIDTLKIFLVIFIHLFIEGSQSETYTTTSITSRSIR
jgi:hypothetical protein